nr:ERAD-associated E3 ubiquitin-protein ligase DOA10-like [Ipomoea batatas]
MASPSSAQVQLPQIPPSSSNTNLRSRSINTSDLESGSSVCCRICLETDVRQGDELIAPCLCKGTQEFVHRKCLDHWRSVKEGFAFTHCTTCKAAFRLEVKEVKFDMVTRIKHKLFVVRDFFIHFVIAQAVIAVLSGYAYLVDYKGFVHNFVDKYFTFLSSQPSISFYYSMGALGFLIVLGFVCFITICAWLANLDGRIAGLQNCVLAMFMWNWIPAATALILTIYVFAVCGVGYGLFLATTIVHKSWHRHYGILMKRNLTKVYVVVDQHGHYTPSTLDPIHEQQLRSLNLM